MAAEATKPLDPTPPPPPSHFTDHNTSRTLLKSFAAVCKWQQQNSDVQTREPTTYRNKPAIVFTEEEVSTLSTPYQYALIGKTRRNPELRLIKDGLMKLGLAAPFTIGSLHPGFVLINLGSEKDFNRMWTKQEWFIAGTTLRLFKWTPEFSIEKESSVPPVWIGFPHLPIHLFSKGVLYSLASTIGTPLKLDEPTAVRKRPGVARVCVEIDLRKNIEDSTWIKNGATWFLQKIVVEDRPAYCDVCWRRGHTKDSCKGKEFEKKNKERYDSAKIGSGK